MKKALSWTSWVMQPFSEWNKTLRHIWISVTILPFPERGEKSRKGGDVALWPICSPYVWLQPLSFNPAHVFIFNGIWIFFHTSIYLAFILRGFMRVYSMSVYSLPGHPFTAQVIDRLLCETRLNYSMSWSTTWSLLGRCLTPATSSPPYRLSSVHWLKLLSDASIQHRDGRQNQSWHFISYQLDWYSDICLASGNLLYDLSIHVWVKILAWWCPSATIKARSLDHNSDCALQIFRTDWRNFISVRVCESQGGLALSSLCDRHDGTVLDALRPLWDAR